MEPNDEQRTQAWLEIPTRALHFLRGAALNPEIRRLLAQNGYAASEHAEGVRLLGELLAVPADDGSWSGDDIATVAELEDFANRKLPVIEAVMRRRFPAEHARLFGEPPKADGPAGAKGGSRRAARRRIPAANRGPGGPMMATLLFIDEVGKLAADSPALLALAQMGVTPEVRARIERVRTGPGREMERDTSSSASRAALEALERWVDDWGHVARRTFDSREPLIRLGLAKRRRGDEG